MNWLATPIPGSHGPARNLTKVSRQDPHTPGSTVCFSQYPITYQSTETRSWNVPLESGVCIPIPVPSPFQPFTTSDVLTGAE